jgi:nucleoside-diphosphate-sugar epimerase
MRLEGKRILVTGAGGFIGRHLIGKLLEKNSVVIAFDKRRFDASNTSFVEGDILNLGQLVAASKGCDAIVHLACMPAQHSLERPAESFRANAFGTYNALHAAMENKIPRFVFASTALVYGDSQKAAAKECLEPMPLAPYAAGKLSGENCCSAFSFTYGLKPTILRFFNVFGKPMGERVAEDVVSIFSRSSLKGQQLTINNPEEQRDFIHVSDVASAIVLALEREQSAGETINIGTGKPTSTKELALIVSRLAGTKPKIICKKTKAKQSRLFADTKKAERLLGFRARVTLEQGIRELLESPKD